MVDHARRATSRWPAVLWAASLLAASAAPVAAQNEDALRAFFEGKRVTLKIDMPGTQEGVDVHADSPRPVDFKQYGDRIKAYGTAIHSGESAIVTLVKVKKDIIEFHLGGGGFGAFGDDTSTTVAAHVIDKSQREKDLEKLVKDENDPRRRRDLQTELDTLRDRRERENRRLEEERLRAEAEKRELVAQERMKGGSRFNLRFEDVVPATFQPQNLMTALAEYVDFANAPAETAPAALPPPAPLPAPMAPPQYAPPVGDAVQPKKGMSRVDAERAFGGPVDASARREGDMQVTTLVFVRGDERISADFVDDILIRYSITSR